MSGYRQHSFDPNAFEQPGRPLRPFNWVQWTGFALAMVGLAINLVYFAGRLGWIAPLLDSTSPAFLLLIVGAVLINSRREPSTLEDSEQLRKNRKVLFITLGVCAVVLGIAAAIEFTGA